MPTLDWRRIRHGYDGTLRAADGKHVAEVPRFRVEFEQSNRPYLPSGSRQNQEIPGAYSLKVIVTETVVDDNRFARKILEDAVTGRTPEVLNLRARVQAPGSDRSKDFVGQFNDLVPSGRMNLLDMNGDDLFQREITFHCNDAPGFTAWLNAQV